MRDHALFDKIDLHLIRVLHTVLTERSVSRAAVRLGMHQPAVSAALKRLRDLAGDPLLVRSGASMMPTDAALRMVEPAGAILRSAEALFSDARGFDPRTPTRPGARGVIHAHLYSLGRQRLISARCARFSLIPSIVASSLLVLTTGRQYCERYVEQLPLAILPCPVPFPRLMYYQLWHARTHHSAAAAWLRDCVKTVAASLRKE